MYKETVCITGITGYLGSQVCLTFLQSEKFNVRGTVRSKRKSIKMRPLKQGMGKKLFSQLELVEADMMHEESVLKAIEGCDYVVHTASPFPIESPKDEMEVIKPAVDGTLHVMKACMKAGVKRIVLTSSIAALYRHHDPKKLTFNEKDWSATDIGSTYEKSKTLAEMAAWDFLKKNPECKMELVTINPALIFGPNMNTGNFSSGDIIKKMMLGEFPGLGHISFPTVDVRDVAEAHYKALVVPEAAGNRFICYADTIWLVEVSKWLNEKYKPKGYPVTTLQLPWLVVFLASFFDAEAAEFIPHWGKVMRFDTSKTKEILGIEFRDIRQGILDMGDTLIKTGYAKL